MAKITRIAATVTARYFPGQGASDAFYLDGRLTGRRETRAADITLDREDRGFFFATFAHQASAGKDSLQDIQEQRTLLDRILSDVKKSGKNIDAEINELADTGVTVAGRMTIQQSGVRQPYFAGIIVKDQEIASTTIGRGCTYLYRNEVLYPLTDDDYEMEEIDAFGRPVDNMDMYCAGVAGTVRYSNIAQLQMDDCLIACNREIMEALGQREVLRILYEAEDQCEAAGMIITEAAAKNPGASLQFLIGFVESATVSDKPGRAFGRGRARSTDAGPTVKLPVPPVDMSNVPAMFGGRPEEEPSEAEAFEPEEEAAADDELGAAEKESFVSETGEMDEPDELDIPDIRHSPHEDYATTPGVMPAFAKRKPVERDMFEDSEITDDEDSEALYGRSRLGMYVIIALVTIATIAALYLIFRNPPDDPQTTTTPASEQTTSGATTGTPGQTTATTASGETTATSGTGQTTATAGPTTTIGTISPDTPKNLPTEYTVQNGNTLFRIAQYFYDSGDGYYVQLIRDANGLSESDAIYVGQSLTIPEVPEESAETQAE